MPTCKHFYKDLADCLVQSDCVKIERRTPKECLDPKYDSVPQSCRLAQRAWAECRVRILNPRMRLRPAYGTNTTKDPKYDLKKSTEKSNS